MSAALAIDNKPIFLRLSDEQHARLNRHVPVKHRRQDFIRDAMEAAFALREAAAVQHVEPELAAMIHAARARGLDVAAVLTEALEAALAGEAAKPAAA